MMANWKRWLRISGFEEADLQYRTMPRRCSPCREDEEPTEKDDHLFIGQRGPWSSQAIQQIVKKYFKRLEIYESGKSVHSLRHSYAVQLYAKEKDLRAVQKQLRHVSIQSTLIYADVSKEEIQEQIKGLWN